ncbi:MAG TPA: hypothetical protein VMS08_02095 [Candidatus Saccharimonadia bacterium]|nr:hypothetical protein [Candidatus Saccharimonadia bacterium]
MSYVSKRKKVVISVSVICLILFVGFTGICLLAWAQAGQLMTHGLKTNAKVTAYTPGPTTGVQSPSTLTVEFTPNGASSPITATASDNSAVAPPKTVAIIYDSADPQSFVLTGQDPQHSDIRFGALAGVMAMADMAILAAISRKEF